MKEEHMPKVYPTPTGTEKRTDETETGVKKGAGIYDKPGGGVRAFSPAMIAIIVILAIIIFFVVYTMMH